MADTVTYFKFLDDLRASGQTNMYGAAPYLAGRFNLDKNDARSILGEWMRTFDGKSSAEDRAESSRMTAGRS